MTTYWFMRMRTKQEGKVKDFSEELWRARLVGVLYGTWGIDHVLNSSEELDDEMLSAEAIKDVCEQPKELDFDNSFLKSAFRFLRDIKPGHRVVTATDYAIRIGTVAEGYRDDPNPLEGRGKFKERFKCRPIESDSTNEFRLKDLPASYRLISNTGQSSVQRIKAYKHLVELLDRSASEADVCRKLSEMPIRDFLDTLSDKQWEVLCGEYLRAKVGFRSLLLAVGGTLKGIDLCGVDQNRRRVLAQCKNSSDPWRAKDVVDWTRSTAARAEDSLYFFNRGGVDDSNAQELNCIVISGEDIAKWLDDDPKYQQDLKVL